MKNIHRRRLSNSDNHVVVKSFAGATISDMEDFLKPAIRKEPNSIILHVGTNDIEHDAAKRVAEGVLNLAIQVTENSPSTEIVISAILPRTDKPNLMNKVNEANRIMYSFCVANNWTFIDYNLINKTCLNTRGLHLNRKGTRMVAKNISFYIKSN